MTAVTLCGPQCKSAPQYNHRRSELCWADSDHHVPESPLSTRETAQISSNDDERRGRGPDRRRRTLRALFYGNFNPRRRGPRREHEAGFAAVDWHHPQWLGVAVLILLLSCADAFLTLTLMNGGAYEANPFMAPLVGGSALRFTLVKLSLTGGGVVVLTLLARTRLFRRVPISLVLYGVLAAYAVLVVYEFQLLTHLQEKLLTP